MSHDAALFVIVEGKVNDPYFAERLCSTSSAVSRRGYEIRLIGQIANRSGQHAEGKAAVLELFEYCRRRRQLRLANSRREISLAFLVDRDAQHIVGGRKRSPHLIYTELADSEAHGFAEGSPVDALVLAASLDRKTAEAVVDDLGPWMRDLADAWRPWIELCYVAEAVRARTWVGLGKNKSHIHTGPGCRTLDNDKFAEAKKSVRSTTVLPGDQYRRVEQRTLARISREYEAGRQATLLKGKWLPAQLEWLVGHYFHLTGWNSVPWHNDGFVRSAGRCYMAHIPASAPAFSLVQGKLEALLV